MKRHAGEKLIGGGREERDRGRGAALEAAVALLAGALRRAGSAR